MPAGKGRPDFVDKLLARPLPLLTPPNLSDTKNKPYREDLRDAIADLICHPCLEASLHLMNDDLFSAHFLLRKLQEDDWGKWLHAMLHQAEGDLEGNAKLWYEQVPESLLAIYWKEDGREAVISNMYRISRVKSGKANEGEEILARQLKWGEMCAAMVALEEAFGWEAVDGTLHYTKDQDDSHKSRVLGEGYRKFNRAGYREK